MRWECPIPFPDVPRGTCKWCAKPIFHTNKAGEIVQNRRKNWHTSCVGKYLWFKDLNYARDLIFKRDRGICRPCGLDTDEIQQALDTLRRHGAWKEMERVHGLLRSKGFDPTRSLWELDHIQPIWDGGAHDPRNAQTACQPCHKQKTRIEAGHRAKRKRMGAVRPTPLPLALEESA